MSFHGIGITVELVYPEEAHPEDSIDYNVTIASNTSPNLNFFNLTIYGTINQTLQEIKSLIFSGWGELTDPITNRINVSIPKDTFGRLYCTLHAETDQDTDYLSTSFYTTHVNQPTFSELLVDYDQLLSDYSNKESLVISLRQELDDLDFDYSSLETDYELKSNLYQLLLIDYENLNLTSSNLSQNYENLTSSFDLLTQDSISMQDYIETLEGQIEISNNTLNTDRNIMVVFIIILVGLIGLIIYLRNKQKEPYVVIRKETVSMKPEKKRD